MVLLYLWRGVRPLRVLSSFGAFQNTSAMSSLAELVVPHTRPCPGSAPKAPTQGHRVPVAVRTEWPRCYARTGESQFYIVIDVLGESLFSPEQSTHKCFRFGLGENKEISSFSVNSVQNWKVLTFRVTLPQGFYCY